MGHLSPVSVLFADARGFTSLIHGYGPEEITPFIDEFFKRCYNIVINHDGIMDHFRGDAILGFSMCPSDTRITSPAPSPPRRRSNRPCPRLT
ncbi:MAG: adenylate/guanylate cyclase domain-containing protein [SAR202 cluster bacterium]|nr:adenylate/guanylate cyclase domain-containing protein [SAR202 cluster bacterium]MDP6302610.1 adenylate/guanylate cyclase domain-containing protein [SAR202 cluster bacterium]MDP7105275.1 adenylate/guanylate cyclase domain-containing protein [SAR202 cluster bacterium]MDP7226863.1 adenylate/guanylate cyclase domain-containing protein [SAR202 cluster bacterium]